MSLETRIADLEERLKKCRETGEFFEAENKRLEKVALSGETDKGLLNQAMCATLYFGQHHELCKAPKNATKVHDACDCGLSDFLVGNGLIGFAAVYLGVALKHLEYGATCRNLRALANELDAARAEKREPNLEIAARLGPETKQAVASLTAWERSEGKE